MKGLLIKDLCLLRNQKRLAPIFGLLAIWFTLTQSGGFAFPFLAMMAAVLAQSTLSYDEAGRGYGHLFTLPFERRTYVTEKYLLGALLLAAALALGGVCTLVRALAFHDVDAGVGLTALYSLCSGALMLSFSLPMRIRFGGEQGRIVMYIVFAVIGLASALLSRMIPGQAAAAIEGLTKWLPLAAVGLAAALTCAGWLLSVRWIRGKDF